MKRYSTIRCAAFAAVAALGVVSAGPSTASGEVVIAYNTYCVGYRANLYDADWRLRCAQADQWQAQDDLAVARRREGEVALVVEDQQALVDQYAKRVAESDAAMNDARARLHAYEKRIDSAKSDLDAARTLHDAPGVADAETRVKTNEAGAAGAADDLKAAEASAAPLNEVRGRLVDAQSQLPHAQEDFAAAHDAVFAARVNLDQANLAVAQALHDRDEALWLLHRDEILRGRAEFAATGFRIDLAVWGGRMPSDPEVVHAYYVHPVSYWVERPLEVQTRVVEVDNVVEIRNVHQIQRSREPRFHEIEVVEKRVPIEQRRAYARQVTVERHRLVAEKSERATATVEHRAPHISPEERAETRAMATKARADAKASQIEARADAKSEQIKARADAKSEVTEARADAKARETEARADARAKETEAHADAKAKQTEAKVDSKAKQTEARADAKSKEAVAHADARNKAASTQNKPKADAAASTGTKSKSPYDRNSGPLANNRSSSAQNSRNNKGKDKDRSSQASNDYGR